MTDRTLEIRAAISSLTETCDVMTVRGIFYALVARGVVPKDEARGYRVVQRQVAVMREAGMLPWAFVADGTRWVRRSTTYNDVDDALLEVARGYRRDLWRSQGWRIEVWLEKDALADVIYPTVDGWGVPLFVTRGVSSSTYTYNAAQDVIAHARNGQRTMIFALFDYDAGGERGFNKVREISGRAGGVGSLMQPAIDRLALTAEQVEAWSLPTRPAKKSDPQAAKWGNRPAVELDAIPTGTLIGLVDDAIRSLVDPRAWNVEQAVEAEERRGLEELMRR